MHQTYTAFTAWNMNGWIGDFFQMDSLNTSNKLWFTCKDYTILEYLA
jgi:hypothetical protein